MKAKIMIFIGAAALVTLSFTFAQVETDISKPKTVNKTTGSEPVGGFAAVEITK